MSGFMSTIRMFKRYLHNQTIFKRIKRKYKCEQINDKRYYIIWRSYPYCGIFSTIVAFLTQIKYAIDNGMTPIIDMENFQSMYTDSKQLTKNVWEYYLLQPFDGSINEAYRSKKSKFSNGDYNNETRPSDDFYNGAASKEEYAVWKKLWDKYIIFNDNTLNHIKQKEKELLGDYNVMGCLCRGTDYFEWSVSQKGKMGCIDKVVDLVERTFLDSCCEKLFLATEDQTIHEKFVERFGDALIFQKTDLLPTTCKNNGEKFINTEMDRYKNGLDYITNVMLLAKCSCFIGARTSASILIPMLSNNMKFIEFYDMRDLG